MPELPEVETIARQLREGRGGASPYPEPPGLVGRTVTGGHLLWERTLAEPSPQEFWERVVGQRIQSIGRRGKYLVFHLSQDQLLIHLRMSGDLFVKPSKATLTPHIRLVLDLDGGWCLAFQDTRKFGRVWLLADPEPVLGSLGPEPLDEAFTAGDLYQLLQSRRRQLKAALLDQKFLAGLGNIYVDEALHQARLHPLTLTHEVSRDQADSLWAAIRAVLLEGIRRNGASIDWAYRGGEFQNQFQVYQRTGEPCPRCGRPIERILVSQRGTHFCPQCQPHPASLKVS